MPGATRDDRVMVEVPVTVTLVNELRREGQADLSLQVVWAARGEVDHWGHRHSRRNLYEAIVDLGIVESAWKIVGLETLEERRIEPFGPVAQAAEIEN